MNTMINFAMRLLGLGKVVDALDGETSKACIVGLGKILTGGAAVLTGSAHVAALLLAAHGGADYLAIGQQLYHGDADTAAIAGGFLLILSGYQAIAQRHAIAKLANAVADVAAAAAPVTPTAAVPMTLVPPPAAPPAA